jgi:hypothetical protein
MLSYGPNSRENAMRQSVPPTLRSMLGKAGAWALVWGGLIGLAGINQLIGAVAAFVVALCSASSASASEKARIKSRFTTVELKACEPVKAGPEGSAWTCKGLNGYPVYVADGDLRQFVSFGPQPHARRAATQTLQAFNSIFAPQATRATIEWRFRRSDGRDVPYATIIRFYTSRGTAAAKPRPDARPEDSRGEVLVVTKVTATDACQMARIEPAQRPTPLSWPAPLRTN